ncbi:MAG: hypothetical protein HQL24_03120 [Candidatus Omnitrophica bacterium]|nr:hypothetical protein [Candidatus Omnitrophota bacterium]
MAGIKWPDGKNFAFTIFDDPDFSTVQNTSEVYALLYDLGFKTTKSVWPLRSKIIPRVGGEACEDGPYLSWVLDLQKKGFEIGFHNAASYSSLREDTIRGLDRFQELFGGYPQSMANHSLCQEGIYWGSARLTGIEEAVYNLLTFYKRKNFFRGHVVGDPFFWGDLCKSRIKYVRNFVFSEINTLKVCPFMPYYDPARPFVNQWFASSNGGNVQDFVNCVNEFHQDRLEAEGGACIMYTHFAKGFQDGKVLNSRFKALMGRFAKKGGWFVPATVLLDYLLKNHGGHVITDSERATLESRWLFGKILKGPN